MHAGALLGGEGLGSVARHRWFRWPREPPTVGGSGRDPHLPIKPDHAVVSGGKNGLCRRRQRPAVLASILIALRIFEMAAIRVATIANNAAVSFGARGAPVIRLAAMTGLPLAARLGVHRNGATRCADPYAASRVEIAGGPSPTRHLVWAATRSPTSWLWDAVSAACCPHMAHTPESRSITSCRRSVHPLISRPPVLRSRDAAVAEELVSTVTVPVGRFMSFHLARIMGPGTVSAGAAAAHARVARRENPRRRPQQPVFSEYGQHD